LFVMKRHRWVAVAVLVAALLVCAGLASLAGANYTLLTHQVAQREGRGRDFAYLGPQFEVGGGGTSADGYICPPGQDMSNWIVVGDNHTSTQASYSTWHSGSGNQITLHVTNWSRPPAVKLRAVISCTNAPEEFPYTTSFQIPDCRSTPRKSCTANIPPFEIWDYWAGVVAKAHTPGESEYAALVPRAFCWSSTAPGCAGAPVSAKQFALHDGTDAIATSLTGQSLTRPPAVHLAEPSGCKVRRMQVSEEQRSGALDLVLHCRALNRGAAAHVRIGKPRSVSFRLHAGSGSVRVQLTKPPGTAEPLMYLAYGPANKTCRSVRSRVHAGSRTFLLGVNAHCGRAAGNAVAHLYVGGLIG
jgi:hypothetical protein